MQEPFCSLPLIWIMQEDTLANRLPMYKESGNLQLISHWKNVLSRADVVVFSDLSLPVGFQILGCNKDSFLFALIYIIRLFVYESDVIQCA